jgi:hypothetical protein
MVERVCGWREESANSAKAREPSWRGGASVLRGRSKMAFGDWREALKDGDSEWLRW